jgi:hypothetical protein
MANAAAATAPSGWHDRRAADESPGDATTMPFPGVEVLMVVVAGRHTQGTAAG